MPKSDAKNNEKNLFIAETICFAYHLLSLKKQNISYLILIQKKKNLFKIDVLPAYSQLHSTHGKCQLSQISP